MFLRVGEQVPDCPAPGEGGVYPEVFPKRLTGGGVLILEGSQLSVARIIPECSRHLTFENRLDPGMRLYHCELMCLEIFLGEGGA